MTYGFLVVDVDQGRRSTSPRCFCDSVSRRGDTVHVHAGNVGGKWVTLVGVCRCENGGYENVYVNVDYMDSLYWHLNVVLMMRKNKLMELTPDKWGLLVYLNEYDTVDLTTIKRFMKDVAESGLAIAEDNLSVAEKLLEIGLSNRTVIHKSYYSMYHAARSAVYLQMQLMSRGIDHWWISSKNCL